MTDRELLELAAKAAGINARLDSHDQWRNCTEAHPAMNMLAMPLWNPLTDDGDALRLAVKLNLWEAIRMAHRLVSAGVDIYAATRRAIVLAAAEIGKAMP